jgi:uncharacterized protein YndB with AHSA1/START domain/uncharacterized protein YciI
MAAIAFLRTTRAGFQLDPSADELMALGAHLSFLRGLASRGEVTVAGPAEDGSQAIVVFPHLDAAQAEVTMRSDPCVQAGIFECRVVPWRMSVFGTGTGRDWQGFTQAIHVRAQPSAVWRAVATCDGLERWFLARAEAWTSDGRDWPRDRMLEAPARLRMTWTAVGTPDARGACAPTESSEDNGVESAEPPMRIRMGWYAGKGWIEFRIVPHVHAGMTTVELEQRMHPTSDFKVLESAYVGCREGWAFYLANLKSVLEHGMDLRDRSPGRAGLVNI